MSYSPSAAGNVEAAITTSANVAVRVARVPVRLTCSVTLSKTLTSTTRFRVGPTNENVVQLRGPAGIYAQAADMTMRVLVGCSGVGLPSERWLFSSTCVPERENLNDLFTRVDRVVEVVLREPEEHSTKIWNRSVRHRFSSIRQFFYEEEGCFEVVRETARILRSILNPPFCGSSNLPRGSRCNLETKAQRGCLSSARRARPSSNSPR